MPSVRPCVTALDAMLGLEYGILDHGFIRVVDYMGDDQSIVDAARVSYGTGTRQAREDQGLLHYLMRHRHTTPFEMCEIKFHVKLPIFVARQWIRHRTASVNEYSARYSILDKEFYIPDAKDMARQSTANRQGRGEPVDRNSVSEIQRAIEIQSNTAYSTYQWLLAEDGGDLARELARMSLSLNYYTQWYWKVDLHNLFNFLILRADDHAQFEIRVYAEKMLEIVEAWCPMAYAAFVEHRRNAVTFSASGMKFLRELLNEGLTADSISRAREASGIGAREFNEILTSFDKIEALVAKENE